MAPNVLSFRALGAYCCSRGHDYEVINSFCHAPSLINESPCSNRSASY